MKTIQISIEANPEQQEILISQLADLGAEGFEETSTHLLAYFNELTFPSYEVNEILKDYSIATQEIEEKNWNEAWEQSFEPVTVEDFCAVRAGFHEPVKNVEHEIVITPKMSFGTGHHATTYMMIAQMRDLDFTNKKVFDFGTGTGILAILAEKMGAEHIRAIDVDDWSVRNAIENVEQNNCSRIELKLTSSLPEGNYDIILANINRNVILDYLPQLKQILRAEGYLLLSGLLTSDEKDIIEACEQQGLRLQRENERNNWISLLFIN